MIQSINTEATMCVGIKSVFWRATSAKSAVLRFRSSLLNDYDKICLAFMCYDMFTE